MNHFYNSIQGWNHGIPQFYKEIVSKSLPNKQLFFVEVGSWKGSSSACMAVEIINSGKNIHFDCVDTWEGSEEHNQDASIIKNTLFDEFMTNMKPVGGYFLPIRLSSLEASKAFKDDSLDFVFIDAAHDYDNVKADILAWLPKVKSGGILSGHDYLVDWPGVIKAVNELLTDVHIVNNIIWYIEKN